MQQTRPIAPQPFQQQQQMQQQQQQFQQQQQMQQQTMNGIQNQGKLRIIIILIIFEVTI